MRIFYFALAFSVLAGCSMGELRRVDGPQIDQLGVGIVLDVTAIEIDSEESLGERAAVGVAAAGVIGGVAASITESRFTTQTVQRYVIRLSDGTYHIEISRSVIEMGACVEITKKEGQDLSVLRKKNDGTCSVDLNK